jgi:hypothetical protein
LPGADPERRRLSALRYQRLQAIGDFFVEATRYPISGNVAGLFSRGWRIQHNLMYVEETLQRLDELGASLTLSQDFPRVQEPLADWFDSVETQLQSILDGSGGALDFIVLAPAYEQVKLKLLQAALAGQISRVSLDAALQMCSLSRRLSEQWLRALHHWREMKEETDGAPVPAADVAVTPPSPDTAAS